MRESARDGQGWPRGTHLNQTDPLSNTTRFSYDRYGNVLSAADPLGNATRFAYDAVGDLNWTSSPTGVTTTSTYDSKGEVTATTSISDGGRNGLSSSSVNTCRGLISPRLPAASGRSAGRHPTAPR